ncbi:beta-1,3-galactosyltransferase 5 [Eupeodes corollae]|uniref:beta-1,3-galactosyltransferase 5 n=1 Tax=Eupeodes corollae TaxID=290404 RepID=UPI00249132FB|nr:beta-1,3-galactosyltransferase 5 [Eupeodes corollae]
MIIRGRLSFRILSYLVSISLILSILWALTHSRLCNYDEYVCVETARQIEEELQSETLVDLKDFKYTIDNDVCNRSRRELIGIIIVTSYVGHDELRSAHRQSISQSKLVEIGFSRVFLLAEIPASEKYIKQSQVIDENRKFGDILQGNFVEAYRNLTYKHVMGLKWATTKCFRAKFIIKIDDDVVFDLFHLRYYLEGLEINGSPNKFMAGYVLDNKTPIRLTANKWSVTRDEYPGDVYPDYLSGWLYITNPITALQLVRRSQSEKFFWIDDTWVTGVLRDRLSIPLIKLNEWFSSNAQFLDCCIRDVKDFSYECEYFVGPNGGDTKMIIEFLHGIEKCYFDECTKRTPEQSVKQTCVSSAKRFVPDHGDALIREVKL